VLKIEKVQEIIAENKKNKVSALRRLCHRNYSRRKDFNNAMGQESLTSF
jgi:hypothetical protein